jgi:hypothetical protein
MVGCDPTFSETHFPLGIFSYLFSVSDFTGGLGSQKPVIKKIMIKDSP